VRAAHALDGPAEIEPTRFEEIARRSDQDLAGGGFLPAVEDGILVAEEPGAEMEAFTTATRRPRRS
jgi:hypothetical protein